jgi:hypothetical protein
MPTADEVTKTVEELEALARRIDSWKTATPPPNPPPVPDPPPTPIPSLELPQGWQQYQQIWSSQFSVLPHQSGWYSYDGAPRQNGEGGYFTPNNMELVDSGANGKAVRLWLKRQQWGAYKFTAAMAEHGGLVVGRGKYWAAKTRQRWQEEWGIWPGFWFYNAKNRNEVDVTESVNKLGPTVNIHLLGTQQIGSKIYGTYKGQRINPADWYEYFFGCSPQGCFVGLRESKDPLNPGPWEIGQVAGSWWADQLRTAEMFAKIQLSVAGPNNWPTWDAQSKGQALPVPHPTFTQSWCDYDYVIGYEAA